MTYENLSEQQKGEIREQVKNYLSDPQCEIDVRIYAKILYLIFEKMICCTKKTKLLYNSIFIDSISTDRKYKANQGRL